MSNSKKNLTELAQLLGQPLESLKEHLVQAGIGAKDAHSSLNNSEMAKLLQYLKKIQTASSSPSRVSVRKKVTSSIQTRSRSGKARTIYVEFRQKHRKEEAEAAKPAATEDAAETPLVAATETEVSEPEIKITQMPEKPVVEASAQTEAPASPTQSEPAEPPKSERKSSKKNPATERAKKDEVLHVEKTVKRQKNRPSSGMPRRVHTQMTDRHRFTQPTAPVVHQIEVGEFITVAEIASKLSIKSATVIKKLMEIGKIATVNQSIDQDTAILVVEELGHQATARNTQDPEIFLLDESTVGDYRPRAPIVTIMGHVDHGKTSLLDYLRKSRIAEGEAGNITQHIGAYQVIVHKQPITFIDTPGHGAFAAMRARGANLTDIVILVVAADDSIMPQTIEAMNHARNANVPIVVAINKIDLESANVERVERELAEHGLLPEKWGGDTLTIGISAKEGTGIQALLEALLLQAELLELKAPWAGPAAGMVLESRQVKGRGNTSTLLVRQGQLQKGAFVVAGTAYGRIRAMYDENGKALKTAGVSTPVEVMGLSGIAEPGKPFHEIKEARKARELAQYRAQQEMLMRQSMAAQESELNPLEHWHEDRNVINLVVKADVQGSLEVLEKATVELSNDQVTVSVIHKSVGIISESDINLAIASHGTIIGFNVNVDPKAQPLIQQSQITVHHARTIYDVVQFVQKLCLKSSAPETVETQVGQLNVLQTFTLSNGTQVLGGLVTEGKALNNCRARVLRGDQEVYDGEVEALRRFKDPVKEVASGTECGLSLKHFKLGQENDSVIFYTVREVAVED